MDWYTEVDSGEAINQGDIFFKCPVLVPDPEFDFSKIDFSDLGSFNKIELKIYTIDLIVLTQSCDIVNDPPIDEIILARIDDVKGESNTFLKEVLSNRRPPYHLIGKNEIGNIKMNYQIVDFTSIYSIPRVMLEKFKEQQKTRLRLNSPYLELMSQRFGNLFSRVGLPKNISKSDLLLSAK